MFSCGLYREPSVHLCFWTPRLLQHSDVLEIKASLISLAESLKFWHVYRLFVLFFFFFTVWLSSLVFWIEINCILPVALSGIGSHQ